MIGNSKFRCKNSHSVESEFYYYCIDSFHAIDKENWDSSLTMTTNKEKKKLTITHSS